jgi:hypothetical protein
MKHILVCIVAVVTVVGAASAQDSPGLHIRAGGGIGYTFLDIESETYLDESSIHDWGQGHGRAFVEVLPFGAGSLCFGVGVGYEYFFWYEYRWGTGSTPYYVESEVDAFYVGAVGELRLGSQGFLTLEPNAYVFSDGVGFGVGLSGGRSFPISDRLAPVFAVRSAVILWDYLVPLEAYVALEYSS